MSHRYRLGPALATGCLLIVVLAVGGPPAIAGSAHGRDGSSAVAELRLSRATIDQLAVRGLKTRSSDQAALRDYYWTGRGLLFQLHMTLDQRELMTTELPKSAWASVAEQLRLEQRYIVTQMRRLAAPAGLDEADLIWNRLTEAIVDAIAADAAAQSDPIERDAESTPAIALVKARWDASVQLAADWRVIVLAMLDD